MVEENKLNIESELFALINTILNAYSKFKEGVLKQSFFQKKVRNTINDLVKFNIYLDENKIKLSELLEKMNFNEQYYSAIEIINKLSALEFSGSFNEEQPNDESQGSRTMTSTVLALPSITLEITSAFITLMDILKLKGFHEIELVDKLFNDLYRSLDRFPGMDDLKERVKDIHKRALSKYQVIENVNHFVEEIVDEIYKSFKEFQNKLNLKA
ncbi:MAG: hypothetical protein ACFE8B_09195 [Candidatus Hermodarchaeota archaeon]